MVWLDNYYSLQDLTGTCGRHEISYKLDLRGETVDSKLLADVYQARAGDIRQKRDEHKEYAEEEQRLQAHGV